MGGVPGVAPASVVVIGGGGMAGDNAAAVAWAWARTSPSSTRNVNILRKDRRRAIRQRHRDPLLPHGWSWRTRSNRPDLVIGAVLVPGAKAPKLVTNATVAQMKPGAVLVDIAIDRAAASRIPDPPPTTTRPSRSTMRCPLA